MEAVSNTNLSCPSDLVINFILLMCYLMNAYHFTILAYFLLMFLNIICFVAEKATQMINYIPLSKQICKHQNFLENYGKINLRQIVGVQNATLEHADISKAYLGLNATALQLS